MSQVLDFTMDFILNNPIIFVAIIGLLLITSIYFYLRNSDLSKKATELDKTNQELNKAVMDLNNGLNQKNSEFDNLKLRSEESDRNFVNLNLQYQKCLSDNSALSSQMSLGAEKIRLLEKNVADLQNNIRNLEDQNKDLSTQNETLIRNYQEISDKITATLEEKQELKFCCCADRRGGQWCLREERPCLPGTLIFQCVWSEVWQLKADRLPSASELKDSSEFIIHFQVRLT